MGRQGRWRGGLSAGHHHGGRATHTDGWGSGHVVLWLACKQDPEEAAGGGTDQRASRTTTTTQIQVRPHSARTDK